MDISNWRNYFKILKIPETKLTAYYFQRLNHLFTHFKSIFLSNRMNHHFSPWNLSAGQFPPSKLQNGKLVPKLKSTNQFSPSINQFKKILCWICLSKYKDQVSSKQISTNMYKPSMSCQLDISNHATLYHKHFCLSYFYSKR
jgi:hypothetical protein